jgi:hypothetical protein
MEMKRRTGDLVEHWLKSGVSDDGNRSPADQVQRKLRRISNSRSKGTSSISLGGSSFVAGVENQRTGNSKDQRRIPGFFTALRMTTALMTPHIYKTALGCQRRRTALLPCGIEGGPYMDVGGRFDGCVMDSFYRKPRNSMKPCIIVPD